MLNNGKRNRFKFSDTDKKSFDKKLSNYVDKGCTLIGKIHKEVDNFNGRTRYTAVLEREVG